MRGSAYLSRYGSSYLASSSNPLILLTSCKIFHLIYPHPPYLSHNLLTAFAGDLVRTGDRERAAVPGWSSSVGGWVMNP